MADGHRQVSDDSRVAVVHVREHREIMDHLRVCAFRYAVGLWLVRDNNRKGE